MGSPGWPALRTNDTDVCPSAVRPGHQPRVVAMPLWAIRVTGLLGSSEPHALLT